MGAAHGVGRSAAERTLNELLGLTIAHAISDANYLIGLKPDRAMAGVITHQYNGIFPAGRCFSEAGCALDSGGKLCASGAGRDAGAEGGHFLVIFG